jgi:DNA ligase 1
LGVNYNTMRQSKFHRDIPNTMKMIQQPLPTLYHQGKTGAIVQWNIWTEGAVIVREYGQIDGKMQVARTTATGKNIGKANETTPDEQALLEAKARHKKRLDAKYSLTIEDAKKEVFLPMLAGSFDKRKHSVDYPVDVQPKLDGVRCMAFWNGDHVELMSRGGKKWECCDHIIQELEMVLPKGWVLDGELYIHGKTFQEITKLVKKLRPESKEVVFHVYDIPRKDGQDIGAWDARSEVLANFYGNLYEGKCSSVRTVETCVVADEAEVFKLQSQYLEEGYEGAIVREYDGIYRFGHRSNSLLKVKSFMDDEYEIIGYTTGVGKFDGCVIWICITEDGTEFKVVPQGTMEERKELYEEADVHIGELLKVKFFELTDDNVPRFPVGIGFRLAQDV